MPKDEAKKRERERKRERDGDDQRRWRQPKKLTKLSESTNLETQTESVGRER